MDLGPTNVGLSCYAEGVRWLLMEPFVTRLFVPSLAKGLASSGRRPASSHLSPAKPVDRADESALDEHPHRRVKGLVGAVDGNQFVRLAGPKEVGVVRRDQAVA
jgi:hypothetical protein